MVDEGFLGALSISTNGSRNYWHGAVKFLQDMRASASSSWLNFSSYLNQIIAYLQDSGRRDSWNISCDSVRYMTQKRLNLFALA